MSLAGKVALERDQVERDEVMLKFREKVMLLTNGLNQIEGFTTMDPMATFYVFPNLDRTRSRRAPIVPCSERARGVSAGTRYRGPRCRTSRPAHKNGRPPWSPV